ncbi:MAG: sugar-binding protein [Clostridia bacterium]|nr:sugar-binding protein [Clostridia bacterium]MBR5985037.1 sugar-binding protein [Clostridia bacterium]MBR6498608.1 sugar-binding protein [Clostridia bacterium]
MKKILALVLALIMCLGCVAMAEMVGVSMPTQDLQRWVQDGENMQKELEENGYEVMLTYAANNVAQQIADIENMITKGCKVLVIASIDGGSLGAVLKTAKENDVMVVAYDRLLMDTDAVDFYATFDNYKVGSIQAQFIIEKLELETTDKTYRMEVFAGSPDDNNARFFYAGAMDLLKPYIEAGKLVVTSGQSDFETCAILGWGTPDAQTRMDNLLAAYYTDGTFPDLVLSPNDSLAMGIANSLEQAGCPIENFPVITGQDCDKANMKNIIAGKQSMSVFKDTRTLAAQVVEMVNAYLLGEEVPVNDVETYDNNVKVVPSFLCDPVFADINNYVELLLESGYYTEDDLK